MISLPFVTAGLPGSGGALRRAPEDFRVDELPAYLPSGAGPHLYVRIEKRGRTTRDALRELARALGVAERDAGLRRPEGPRRRHHPVALLPGGPGSRARHPGGGRAQGAGGLAPREQAPPGSRAGQPVLARGARGQSRARARGGRGAARRRAAELLRATALRRRGAQRGGGARAPARAADAGDRPGLPRSVPAPASQSRRSRRTSSTAGWRSGWPTGSSRPRSPATC